MNTLRAFAMFVPVMIASTAAAEVVTLREAVQLAKDYSPDVRSLRSQYESARAKAALALAPTEPSLSVSYNDMQSAFHINNPASTVYEISQPIAFPGKALLNHSALSHSAEAAQAQMRAMELQVSTNVKTAYLQLLQAKQNIDLNDEQGRSYQRILEIAKRRYESGAIPQVDLLNAQVTLYGNNNDMSDLKAVERTARAQLNLLIGHVEDTPIDLENFKYKKLPIPTYAEAERRMVDNREELRSARFQLESAESSYGLAKMSLLPDFQLSAGMSHYNEASASPLAASAPGANTYMFGASITIPLWGLFNERQVIIGAARDRAAADANLQIALNQSRGTLRSTLESLKALETRLENYEQHLLPLSEQALRIALINYSAGKIDFQTLVDTANSRRNIRRDYFAGIVNYLTAASTLGQLLGEDL